MASDLSIDLLDADPFQPFLDYWHARRGKKQMPKRADFKLSELMDFLEDLSIFDCAVRPFRFVYVGFNVSARSGNEDRTTLARLAPDLVERTNLWFEGLIEKPCGCLVAWTGQQGGEQIACRVLYLPLAGLNGKGQYLTSIARVADRRDPVYYDPSFWTLIDRIEVLPIDLGFGVPETPTFDRFRITAPAE